MLHIQSKLSFKDYSIALPAEHMLQAYQERHPRYDKFLPLLAKHIEAGSTVIDVGANCGDTLAAMVEQNSRLKYVCVEPDNYFFEYLTGNISRIKQAVPELDVDVVKSLVGRSVTNVSLEGSGGTRHAVVGSGANNCRSLDDILLTLSCPPVRLLKSDVDGFDYDVIDSAEMLLTKHHPLVFFECQHETDSQKAGYEKTLRWMNETGYVDWTVFDNFGELVLRTRDIDQLLQLMQYVWRQNASAATRTIYYFDVLAVVATDSMFVDRVLAAMEST